MKKTLSIILVNVLMFCMFSFINVSAENYIFNEGNTEEYPCCVREAYYKFSEQELNLDKSELPEKYSFVNNSIVFSLEKYKTAKFYFDLPVPQKYSAFNSYDELYFGITLKASCECSGDFNVKLISSDGSFVESKSSLGIEHNEPFFTEGLEYEKYFTMSEELSVESVCVEVCTNRDVETITVSPIWFVILTDGHNEVNAGGSTPTCTRPGGSGYWYCSYCKKILGMGCLIMPLPHTPVADKAVAATCEKTGLTEGKHCAECKKVIIKQQVIPAIGHKYKWVTKKKATYFENGKQEYKCTGCGKVINTAVTSKKKLEVPSFSLISANKAFKLKYKTVSDATGFQIKYKTGNKTRKVSVNSRKSITKTVSNLKKERTYRVWIRSYRKIGEKTVYSSWSTAKKVKTK